MNFLRVFIYILLVLSVNAQNYGPVKVDVEGYVDDIKGDIPSGVKVVEQPKVNETTPVENKSTDINKTSPEVAVKPKETPVNSEATSQPVQLPNLDQFSTKSSSDSTIIIIIIIAVLLIVIGVVAFIFIKKEKNKKVSVAESKKTVKQPSAQQQQMSRTNVSLSQKISAHEQAVVAESNRATISMPPTSFSSAPQVQLPPTSPEISKATALNQKGQNASGLIIDEDKYFANNDQQANDDFSDLDGPHSIQNQSNNG